MDEKTEDARILALFGYHGPRKIGKGGEGRVYQVFDSERNIDVAVKLADSRRERKNSIQARAPGEGTIKTPSVWEHDPEWPKRLLQEYNALWSGPAHPSLLRPLKCHGSVAELEAKVSNKFDYMQQYKCAFFSMELCSGPVTSKLYTRCTVKLSIRVEWCRQLLEGINSLHRRGLSHRDIKPANLLIANFNADPDSIRIGDFGLSQRVRDAASAAKGKIRIGGTNYYMAPELWSPESFKAYLEMTQNEMTANGTQLISRQDILLMATDQYAAGITIYEILCGQLPRDLQDLRNRTFGSEKDNFVKDLHLSGAISNQMNLVIPEHPDKTFNRIDDVLHKMTQKEPGKRFRTMTDCSNAFERALIFESLRAVQ